MIARGGWELKRSRAGQSREEGDEEEKSCLGVVEGLNSSSGVARQRREVVGW
jgi:hypothetical protein